MVEFQRPSISLSSLWQRGYPSSLLKVYTLKRLGPVSTFLSIEVSQSRRSIVIAHSRYVCSILDRFGFVSPSRAQANTPMEERTTTTTFSEPFNGIKVYQSAVRALMFTAT